MIIYVGYFREEIFGLIGLVLVSKFCDYVKRWIIVLVFDIIFDIVLIL